MPAILHASDLHFGPPFLPDRAEGLLELETRLSPDLVVLSGDFTQRAKTAQFADAAAYVSRFQGPTIVTSGNHDVPLYRFWERAFAPHGNYRRFIESRLNYVHSQPGLTVVSLNSSRALTFTNGRLRTSQLKLAGRAFGQAPASDMRVVVTHHPITPPPLPDPEVAAGWRRALRAFSAMGVDVVLAGHKHRAYEAQSADWIPQSAALIPGATERGATARVPIIHAGTATSSRGRGHETGRNSVNLLRMAEDELRLSKYQWTKPSGAFERQSETRLARGDSRLPESGRASSP
ncbi:MAG: metallophosphoesterase [Gemmatimonadota bacterium]